MCNRCQDITDTLEHMLFSCLSINTLWHDLTEWLSPRLNLTPFLNTENICLGKIDGNHNTENYIILLIKRFIFISKCKELSATLTGAQNFLRQRFNIDINMVSPKIKKDNIEKWAPLNDLLVQ